jgi:hypothetical protein
MPAKTISTLWKNEILAFLQGNPSASGTAVVKHLEQREKALKSVPDIDTTMLGAGDIPSPRTVDRIRQGLKKDKDAPAGNPAMRLYQPYHFPNSHEGVDAVIPWEAAPVAMDLMRYQREVEPDNFRPSNAEVLWCFKIRIADPDVPIRSLYVVAWWLVLLQNWGQKTEPEISPRTVLEAFIELKPYQSESLRAVFAEDPRVKATVKNPDGTVRMVEDENGKESPAIVRLIPRRKEGVSSTPTGGRKINVATIAPEVLPVPTFGDGSWPE